MAATPARWPPALTSEPQILGYLTDINHRRYSRDVGRSFMLGGNIYHNFGDTFCFDASGSFVGVQHNTVSVVIDQCKPLESSYQDIRDDGLVEPLLRLTDEEKQHERNCPGERVVLWAFGSVLEIKHKVGLLWYTKMLAIDVPGKQKRDEYVGTGLAIIRADVETAKVKAYRHPGLLFGADEPGFNNGLMVGDFIHLFGSKPGTSETVLIRVATDLYAFREAYETWTGDCWVYSKDFSGSAPLFKDIQQSSYFRSCIFGDERPYVMVGVSRWGDSKIRIGTAPTLTGPWDIREVGEAKGINHPNSYMYCIYGHPWAIQEEHALMVTWSEHWPGGVVAAQLTFEADEVGGLEARLETLGHKVKNELRK